MKKEKHIASRKDYQLFKLPKNLESGKGPPPVSSSSLPECFDLDLCLLSFFLFLDLDFDFLDSLSSSSLLEDSSEELSESESEDRLERCKQNMSVHEHFHSLLILFAEYPKARTAIRLPCK